MFFQHGYAYINYNKEMFVYIHCIHRCQPSSIRRAVPHFHQMSRVPRNETDVPHFLENGIIIFFVSDYSTCLPGNATK